MVGRFISNNKFGTKYEIDESSFLKIDNEASAYFLGFIYADGCMGVYNGDYSIRIELQAKDVQILKDFQAFIKTSRPMSESYKKEKKYCKVSISNKIIYNNLIEKGLSPRKTFSITLPSEEIVPEHLMRHFIRGYFDGDGSISCSKNQKNSVTFNITSNLIFLRGLQDFLIKKLGVSKTKIISTKSQGIGMLCYSGRRNAKILYDFLYQGSSIFLKRKFERFSAILLNIQNLKRKQYCLISPSGQVIEVFSLSDFCLENNISKKSVYEMLRGIKPSVKGWSCFFKINQNDYEQIKKTV